MPWRDKSIAHIHYPVRAHGGSTRRDFSRQKTPPFSLFVAAIHHASPRHELALAHELKHFARATTIQLGGENDSGGRLGVCGLVDSAAHILCPTWQRKNPATWQRKQAGIEQKENQKVRKHEPRKAYCARTITILLVETRAVQSRAPCAHAVAPRLQGTTQQQHNRQVHVRRPCCS